MLGAAVVAAGAGTVFGLSAKSAAGDIGTATTQSQYDASKDHAQGLAKTATVAWIASGVLAAAGVGLLVWKF